MGRKKYSQNRMYLTYKELVEIYGGKSNKNSEVKNFKMPFNFCNMSFCPTETPVCLKDGSVFELLNIIPYVKKYGKNPVNGENLSLNDLIMINFIKNKENEIICPITNKVLTPFSEVIAIKESGNVYSYEGYKKINLKENNFIDLLSNKPFDKNSIIFLQSQSKKVNNFNNYYFIQKNQAINQESLKENDLESQKFIQKMSNSNMNLDLSLNEENNQFNNNKKTVDLPFHLKKLLHEYEESGVDLERKRIINEINSSKENTNINKKITKSEKNIISDKISEEEKKIFFTNKNIIVESILNLILNRDSLIDNLKLLVSANHIGIKDNKTFYINEKIRDLLISSVSKEIKDDLLNKIKEHTEISSITYFDLNLDLDTDSCNKENAEIFSNKNESNKIIELDKSERRKQFYNSVISNVNNDVIIVITTNICSFEIKLNINKAPLSCENFLELIENGFLDEVKINKLIKGNYFTIVPNIDLNVHSIFRESYKELSTGYSKVNGLYCFIKDNKLGVNFNEINISFENLVTTEKHIILGSVKQTNNHLEKVEVDEMFCPKEEIKILNIDCNKNPFREKISNILINKFIKESIDLALRKLVSKSSTSSTKNLLTNKRTNEVGIFLKSK